MDYYDAPPSYENQLSGFKDALNRVLAGQVLPPVCMAFDTKVTLALLDIVHAVRLGRPTHDLVMRASSHFCSYADNLGATDIPHRQHLSPSTASTCRNTDLAAG